MRKGSLLLAMAATFLVTACSKGIEGTYSGEIREGRFAIKQTFTFDGDGKVVVDAMGVRRELDYTVDGDKIMVGASGDAAVFLRQDDGSISGPMGVRLTKRDDDGHGEKRPEEQVKAASSSPRDEPDLSRPLSQYAEFPVAEQNALVKLSVALADPAFSDEEKLDLLSARYHNERDGFKKRDIAAAELPAINADLKRVERMRYLKVPLGGRPIRVPGIPGMDEPTPPILLEPPRLQSYDFASRSFPIQGVTSQPDCWEWDHDLGTKNTTLPCALKVTDEAVARKIEAANKSFDLDVKGAAYLYVGERGRRLWGRVTHVRLELWTKETKELLGTFDL